MKNEELIALYFEGNLSVSQKERFEGLLEKDAAFKAQVKLEEHLKTAIISTKKDELRNKLKKLEQPKKRFYYYSIAIAASLVIALGLFTLLKPAETVSNEALFAQHFEPYANIISPASRGNETLDDTFKAFRYYDTKQYKMALEKFQNLHSTTNTSYYIFYQAICELQLGNSENAIFLLKTHQNYTDKLSNQTNWYLALAYLKVDKASKAKILLQNISAQKHYNYKAAEAILKKIK